MPWQVRLAFILPAGRARRLDGEGESPDAANNAKLLRLLGGFAGKAAARFAASGMVRSSDGATFAPHCSRQCEGRYQLLAQRSGGFGYDPRLFRGYDQSFGS